jgi:archaellum biogenesis ATPase FlaH
MPKAFSVYFDRAVKGQYEPPRSIPTGIRALDKAWDGGIPENKIAVIAARTSHGKTATTCRLAVNYIQQSRDVMVWWFEDDFSEPICRIASILSGMPLRQVFAKYRAKEFHQVRERIPDESLDAMNAHLEFIRKERPTVDHICETLKFAVPGSVHIIDHLGEINWGDGKKNELIGDGFRKLRKAALDSRVSMVCMAQLNRNWDNRKSQADDPEKVHPVLSDIENSGQLEQAARYLAIIEKPVVMEGMAYEPYTFHVFKPVIRTAHCSWDPDLCVPGDLPIAATATQTYVAARPSNWNRSQSYVSNEVDRDE